MIEDRVVAQRSADVETIQIIHPLVEKQDIEATAAGQLQRLLAGACPRRLITFLHENAFQRAGEPLVRTSDQGG